jgi:hypothetical protein
MREGGWGGFLASVRAIGVTGQQQQGSVVSADEMVRGGAGGGVRPLGGGTNPGSSEPSPAKVVPMHNVATSIGTTYFRFFFDLPFMMMLLSHTAHPNNVSY